MKGTLHLREWGPNEMARRKATETPVAATTAPEPEPEMTDTPVRRRRRRTTVDHAAQTAILVDAVLKSRAGRGASQEALHAVIQWARGVHAEAEALKLLVGRPRRMKAQASVDRIAAFQLNKALLEGVLAGSIGIDVNESGAIVFLQSEGEAA